MAHEFGQPARARHPARIAEPDRQRSGEEDRSGQRHETGGSADLTDDPRHVLAGQRERPTEGHHNDRRESGGADRPPGRNGRCDPRRSRRSGAGRRPMASEGQPQVPPPPPEPDFDGDDPAPPELPFAIGRPDGASSHHLAPKLLLP